MSEVVLRNPDLPGQPIVVPVFADGSVPDWRSSGWVIDLETSPAQARNEKPPLKPAVVAPAPHFAEPAADEPAPELPTETPDPPEPNEQGDTSLELTKE